jgi:hypothetical protein
MQHALTAYDTFGFPRLPDDVIAIIRSSPKEGLCLSVITSSEGFVRLGLLVPRPDGNTVSKLCSLCGVFNTQPLNKFEVRVSFHSFSLLFTHKKVHQKRKRKREREREV